MALVKGDPPQRVPAGSDLPPAPAGLQQQRTPGDPEALNRRGIRQVIGEPGGRVGEVQPIDDLPMADPKAFRVLYKGKVVGYLGEGPGPFISKKQGPPPPPLTVARYTSEDPACETELSRVLTNAKTFRDVLKALERREYTLAKVPYAQVFAPPEPSGDSRDGV